MSIDNHDVAKFPYASAVAAAGSGIADGAELPQRMDEKTFCAFYRETTPTLWSYIRRASGDSALADDILQETFYRFLRSDLPAMESFQMKGYLYRTANSLISDHWRRLKRERRWSLERIFRSEHGKSMDASGDTMRVYQKLKTQEQTLLWLAYVEEFDHREIALALELNEKSVRVLLFRARKKLAGMLSKLSIGPGEGI
jgi:RNA polymerase sigma-70 factor (ECF subfamily)